MERRETLSGTGWSYRYDDAFPPGTDTFLLSAFPVLRPGLRVCDLGAGAGLLGLLLLRRCPGIDVTGVEKDGEACRLLADNAAANGLAPRLRPRQADLRDPGALPAGAFDLAVCNPPYFSAGCGASSPSGRRRAAREEDGCTPQQLCRAGARLLRWGGRLCLVHRPERLTDLLTALREAGAEPKRLRWVHSRLDAAPSLLLLEGRRGGRPGLSVLPPLFLTQPDGSPTAEADAIYFRAPAPCPAGPCKEVTP